MSMSDSATTKAAKIAARNDDLALTAMSTSALEAKLKDLKDKSNKHSQILTAKLASSQSGQNLLHIGTSLSTLPPDLHSLLSQLHPVLSSAEATEKAYVEHLQKLVAQGNEIRREQRKVAYAQEAADLYEDLLAAEAVVRQDASERRKEEDANRKTMASRRQDGMDSGSKDEGANSAGGNDADMEATTTGDKLDRISSLERCAQTTLFLVKDLQSSTDVVAALTASRVAGSQETATGGGVGASSSSNSNNSTLPSMRSALEDDTERAQFLLKLAPRIRRLESDTILSLTYRMEEILKNIEENRRKDENDATTGDNNAVNNNSSPENEADVLLMIGHCMRGLALLGRGKEVESIFARVAIMPLIRSKVSMGRLDEGGPRGECAGLKSLLEDMIVTVEAAFGPVLQLSEVMFDIAPKVPVDLITDGVWVPIATALMADAGIKMAIFSPGIASILQANYVALDKFISELATRLLRQTPSSSATSPAPDLLSLEQMYFIPKVSQETIERAQDRIYRHPKTAEFSKRWNLPIYYQLRFGDCCTRLNKAVDSTTRGGWTIEVYTGDPTVAENLRNSVGFELAFFLELYDTLLGLWRPDVILRPLTNRFLRGAVQLVGRSVAFIRDGMDGKIKFGGGDPTDVVSSESNGSVTQQNGETPTNSNGSGLPLPSRLAYSWGESAPDVASVAWELAILDTSLSHDYVSTICDALNNPDSTVAERNELRNLVSEILSEASGHIRPIVERAWNEIIVKILVEKCSGPLAAVKGVVATYRMTNRPPPTQASPYVGTILRPLKEFSRDFELRTPDDVGGKWKACILEEVTDRYGTAVEELISTVKRTEVALQSRRARRATSGGISDGDKVKLQLYLDFQAYCQDIQEIGIDPSAIKGISKLQTLTQEAQKLQKNGA